MSERYCPVCKQNVEVIGEMFPMCRNCEYEFSVSVDKAELEKLVLALQWESLLASTKQATATFRAKYLEGK